MKTRATRPRPLICTGDSLAATKADSPGEGQALVAFAQYGFTVDAEHDRRACLGQIAGLGGEVMQEKAKSSTGIGKSSSAP